MYSEDLNSNDTPAYKAEILAISAASCEERFVRLTMRLNSNSFEVTDILIPFDQARERLQKELAEVLERLSRGEENERLYSEAMKVIEAADLSSTDVVAETNEAVSAFGEWGHTAIYASLFSEDSNTEASQKLLELEKWSPKRRKFVFCNFKLERRLQPTGRPPWMTVIFSSPSDKFLLAKRG